MCYSLVNVYILLLFRIKSDANEDYDTEEKKIKV